jgi:hypothetical protein
MDPPLPTQPPAPAKKTRKPRKKKVEVPTFKKEHGNFFVIFK